MPSKLRLQPLSLAAAWILNGAPSSPWDQKQKGRKRVVQAA
ncbi:hypothetical protein SynRCC2555_01924 [Synechococcus sp. WH 8101]|nr:hypothetical protein SynRCC2555_01924 [Synechococcus sp. WH 8101]